VGATVRHQMIAEGWGCSRWNYTRVSPGGGPHPGAVLELAHAVLQHGDAEDQMVQHSQPAVVAGQVGGGFRPSGDLQLGQDAGDVVLDRLLGQAQLLGDLAVGLAVGDQ
jgi:hypothetical protein